MKQTDHTFEDIALHAAETGELTEALAMLEQGVDVDAPDRYGHAPLLKAAWYDRPELVVALLRKGANPNVRSRMGSMPVMVAKNPAIVEALLVAGADVNAVTTDKDSNGIESARTPLMRAAQAGNLAKVQVLLSHGADTEMNDSEGRNALIGAASRGHYDVAKALVDAGAKIGLVEAALLGDVLLLKTFLESNADIRSDVIDNALWWTAGNGQIKSIRTLLDAGADVDARNGREGTALMHAALMRQPDAIQLLIDRGADVNARNRFGITALHWSVIYTKSSTDVLRVLLAAGADMNARTWYSYPTHTGGTALMEAAAHGSIDCARMLIEYGADLEISSDIDENGDGGRTALIAAVANGRTDIARLFIESGADINNGGKQGRRPLTIARQRAPRIKNFDIVDLLVAAGAAE